MELTPATVDELAANYETDQPLADVEDEHRELLPATFSSDSYGWRDVEWVVQWYFRRFLGAYPDDERRETETAIRETDFEDVQTAIGDAMAADETTAKLESLTSLSGVEVPVASAFLAFLEPERYLVVSPAEWRVLRAAGELDEPYPDPPSPADYERYLTRCRVVADRCECSLRTLYRALWQVRRNDASGSAAFDQA